MPPQRGPESVVCSATSNLTQSIFQTPRPAHTRCHSARPGGTHPMEGPEPTSRPAHARTTLPARGVSSPGAYRSRLNERLLRGGVGWLLGKMAPYRAICAANTATGSVMTTQENTLGTRRRGQRTPITPRRPLLGQQRGGVDAGRGRSWPACGAIWAQGHGSFLPPSEAPDHRERALVATVHQEQLHRQSDAATVCSLPW